LRMALLAHLLIFENHAGYVPGLHVLVSLEEREFFLVQIHDHIALAVALQIGIPDGPVGTGTQRFRKDSLEKR
jgi:hypothetical protein